MTQHTCPQCGGKLVQIIVPYYDTTERAWVDDYRHECKPCKRAYDWLELDYWQPVDAEVSE